MTYQTGAAATPTQLLDALRGFALSHGWSVLRWEAQGTGYQLALSKGGQHVHLRSVVNEALRSGYSAVTGLYLVGSTATDLSQPWNNQPGTVRNPTGTIEVCGLYEVSSANTYHLFAAKNPDLIWLGVEVSPGIFHHLGFGALAPLGAVPGAAFVSASFGGDGYIYPYTADYLFGYGGDHHGGLPFNDAKSYGQSFVRASVDGVDAWWSVCLNSPLTGKRAKAIWEGGMGAARSALARYWWERAPNTLNGITALIPFTLFVERPSGFFSPLGFTPHLRYVNLQNYLPGESFVLGTEAWRVFPAHSKNAHSGLHGVAVRENA